MMIVKKLKQIRYKILKLRNPASRKNRKSLEAQLWEAKGRERIKSVKHTARTNLLLNITPWDANKRCMTTITKEIME